MFCEKCKKLMVPKGNKIVCTGCNFERDIECPNFKIIVKQHKGNVDSDVPVIEKPSYKPRYSAQEIRAAQDNWIGKRKI